MNWFDGALLLWLILSAFLGYRQGLTVILVRYLYSAINFLLFPFLLPLVSSFFESIVGAEWSSYLGIIFLSIVFILGMELCVWIVSRLRDDLMLTIPDRLVGMTVSCVLGLVLAVLVTVIGMRLSTSFTLLYEGSYIGQLLTEAPPPQH